MGGKCATRMSRRLLSSFICRSCSSHCFPLKANFKPEYTMNTFSLKDHELTVAEVHHNLSPSSLYEHAIRFEKDTSIAENGALVAYSGAKTGRSPKDKRVVEHPDSKNDIWWGPVNIPCDAHTFQINRQRALDYLNTRERLYLSL